MGTAVEVERLRRDIFDIVDGAKRALVPGVRDEEVDIHDLRVFLAMVVPDSPIAATCQSAALPSQFEGTFGAMKERVPAH